MKRISILLLAVFAFALTSNAQACQKSGKEGAACCAKKGVGSTTSVDVKAVDMTVAETAAANDPSIQKRVCPETGNLSFFQKSVCETSGKVSWEEVQYDENAKTFTRVASASMEKDPATGEVKKGESCSKVGGSAACCSKDKGKACCTNKKKS